MTAVWAWVEDDPEVMGDAADLGAQLGLPVVAFAAGADPGLLAGAGAEQVHVWEQPYAAESDVEALLGCLREAPAAVLVPGSPNGSDLAPRLAARLGAACLMDCAAVFPAGGGLGVTRWAHDDRAQECWRVPPGLPLVATMRPGSRGAPHPRPRPLRVVHPPQPSPENQGGRVGVPGEGIHLEGGGRSAPGPTVVRRLPADRRSVRLSEASRIVAAGLGVGSRDALSQIEELADLLGAATGASRPLADRGWVPFDRQIGVTGQVVSADLYVAVGISGAVQHTAGIREARTLVSINLDPACPMMARADLAVVGDAAELVPALLRAIRERQP